MADTPASFDVFAVAPDGYEVHFQLNGPKVYEDAGTLLARLVADGFQPRPQRGASARSSAPTGPMCEQHSVPFRQYSKDGRKGTPTSRGMGGVSSRHRPSRSKYHCTNN